MKFEVTKVTPDNKQTLAFQLDVEEVGHAINYVMKNTAWKRYDQGITPLSDSTGVHLTKWLLLDGEDIYWFTPVRRFRKTPAPVMVTPLLQGGMAGTLAPVVQESELPAEVPGLIPPPSAAEYQVGLNGPVKAVEHPDAPVELPKAEPVKYTTEIPGGKYCLVWRPGYEPEVNCPFLCFDDGDHVCNLTGDFLDLDFLNDDDEVVIKSPRCPAATVLHKVCMYCQIPMGVVAGEGVTGETSGICRKCWAEHNSDEPYPSDKNLQEVFIVITRPEARTYLSMLRALGKELPFDAADEQVDRFMNGATELYTGPNRDLHVILRDIREFIEGVRVNRSGS